MSDERERAVDLTVEIDADPQTVWEAVSEAEQLQRWFPLEAAVEPGEGGSITLSWGPDIQGTAPIEVWEPGRRLVWAESWGGDQGVRVAVDIRIEARGGKTVLRLVQSGFDEDARWDDYLDTLGSGWRYFLYNLKHYLERHPGRPRTMVWDRRKVRGAREEIWRRVTAAYGVDPEVEPGAAADLWGAAQATTIQVRRPIHLALRIPQLDDALLLVELEPGADEFSLGTWLSLYGEAGERAGLLQESLERRYAGALAPAPAAEAT